MKPLPPVEPPANDPPTPVSGLGALLAALRADLRSDPAAEGGETDPVVEARRLMAWEGDRAGGSPDPGGAAPQGQPGGAAPQREGVPPTLLPTSRDAALLADLGSALLEAGPPASPHVVSAALAAFEALRRAQPPAAAGSAPPAPPRGNPGRPRLGARLSARRGRGLRALAAVLVLGLGVAAWLAAGVAQAGPRLALDGVERLSLGRGQASLTREGAQEARLGARFVAGPEELLALHLARGGCVVLPGGESVEVAARPDGSPGAVLRLSSGEALLDTRLGAAGLLLARPGDGQPLGLLEVEGGAAHVALGLGAEGGAAVALAHGAQARFVPAHPPAGAAAGTPVPVLRGPTYVALGPGGVTALGAPAQSLFRELELLGGPLPAPGRDPFVEARAWRLIAGRGERGGAGLRLAPPGTGSTPGAAAPGALLGWTPDPAVEGCSRLCLLLRGPAGLEVSLPDLGVRARLEAAGEGPDPGLSTLELALPDGWADTLGGAELRLALTWPAPVEGAGEPAWVRFDGATFARRGAAAPAPRGAR